MSCIDKIYSVSTLIGNTNCNANCSFCAGKCLRKEQTYEDFLSWERNLESAIKLSARYGGWSLSLTSSGEPTMAPDSVTDALKIYQKCAKEGAYMPNVNLFTNGILLGDDEFCKSWLPIWKSLGLTNIVVSIHSPSQTGQAKAYNVKDYPSLYHIQKNIRKYGIGVRATLLLQKDFIDTPRKYEQALRSLFFDNYDNITSWTVGNSDGSRNKYTPSRFNLFQIRRWLAKNAKLCHGHVWGGGVYELDGKIIRMTDYVTKHDPKKNFVRQLVVFNDGAVHYSWIKEGSSCLK